ncbi:hypothetical protein PAP_04635 [Palaeococcus pacificus DY20341]|uniref:HhH-GPD domain-containing protein n=1 Tax=Palaeococcus pacificus DY20341 TaxID=1343739 RepID=A0A075LXP7_9EURY|nr:DNA-3-methyladenine glycosylase [Palaeococcus pacificus]AIF69338.1 hypothetical protein PAP_04635 [Palaeococcus pacificus DY20341]
MINLRRTTHEMIKNNTWKFENGIFWQAFDFGLAGFDGENFYFSEMLSKKEQKEAKEKIEFILGLNTNLDEFYSQIQDSKFSFLAEEFQGLTQPAAPFKYQALIETIAQQQVNFEFAMKTIGNFVKTFGKRVGELYAFPSAEEVKNLTLEQIKSVKFGYRAEYIKGLTELYVKGELKLDLEHLGEEESIKYLTRFRGIGKWSAELFLAYGLRKNTYPAGDLGLRRGVAKIFGKSVKEIRERDVREIIEPYGKWKSLLAFYITCYDRKTQTEMR